MRIRKLLFVSLSFAFLFSCDGKQDKTGDEASVAVEQQAGIHRMNEYNLTDSVPVGSHVYVYTIHREADDSLKMVIDENGDKFVDNYYELSVTKDGQEFFSKRFTKAAFAAQLDDSFRQNGILDGFRFISDKEGKLLFGVCVSFPESDMSSPFVLTIGPDGSFIIEPDTTPDIEETDSASV